MYGLHMRCSRCADNRGTNGSTSQKTSSTKSHPSASGANVTQALQLRTQPRIIVTALVLSIDQHHAGRPEGCSVCISQSRAEALEV